MANSRYRFRTWDNVANEMHFAGEDADLIFQLGSEGIECTDIRSITSAGDIMNEMEHLIYMQYTGLKDKNGVDIYEGDILSAFHGTQLTEVKWNAEYGLYEVALQSLN